ncbi:type IIG restriction enzyme/methyltransferase [Hymenobacter nivis]|uniref:site-specific DNA-methyltransferase (adenine-specific) n=1 Tax=Hymenobacter nivis TaxID=1850093 RepID=A0A2Z3GDQ9_9BACT|nr:Eco57I restriction-modification methylase domain-containing protein [Hymenobacter nivis]AWM31603.1 hypothetical protein DDQ68_01635 [Hymenobacter nivis]
MLTPVFRTPAQVLNLSFRRQKPTQDELDSFQAARQQLLADLNPAEDEENAKKRIGSFLERVLPGYDFNNRSKRDFVMRRGPATTDPVGVIFEMKHLSKKKEMPTATDLNRRALHQLVYYYMQDRADHSGDTVTHLAITDGHDWYVFDGHDFDRLFWCNAEFKKQFRQFEAGGYTSKKREFFYDDIAQPFLAAMEGELRVAHADLADPAGGLSGQIQLLKLFSATHLLRLPLPGADGNTLNRAFYTELLYLMGLEEVSDKGRKLIRRCAPERRHAAALLENAIEQLRAENLLERLPAAERAAYGSDADPERQCEEIALALCLTWVSRLLFLKLLEGQLRRYHGPQAEAFRFLSPDAVQEYDHLNRLFYRVLNRPVAARGPREQAEFGRVPYLNSTLFEPAALEQATLRISNLDDHLRLPLLAGKAGKSVLAADPQAPASALAYLMRFLEAYDFSSEGGEEVQPQAKALISASVLGLIFEKINGYRDGSFYTPGFVTMYMCRHTLRRAVVRHFAQRYGWAATTLAELRDYVQEQPPAARAGLAAHFATLRVCDPAVGSGHFLVSALNELLVIKSYLRLLRDEEGALPCQLSIDRDELVVQDDDGHFVPYRATYDPATGQRTVGAAFTRLQRALFREKRQLLEHTLFGVDLNPNSVRICRLRLWIELLKHAYYRPEGGFQELEVLPNLDLNIQPGNSLLARFPLGEDLSDIFKDPRYALAAYRDAVAAYFNATGHAAKSELQVFLANLRQHFRATISRRDPLRKRIAALNDDLRRVELDAVPDLFGKIKLREEDAWAQTTVLHKRLEPLETELREREQGTLFRDAFEWRFEFPEILHPDGSFRGFDVVIGNPPYIRQEELAGPFKRHLQQQFVASDNRADLYVYFIELGLKLLAPGGELSFITSNKWLSTGFGLPLRRWLPAHHTLLEYVDFGDLYVFPQTKAYPAILSVRRTAPAEGSHFRAALIPALPPPALEALVATHARQVAQSSLQETGWTLSDAPGQSRLDALKAAGTPLGEYVNGRMYRGILTGLNPAFVITADTRARLVAEDARSAEVIKPFLAGRDLKRYRQPQHESHLILLPSGWTRQQLGWTKNKRGSYSVPPAQPKFATPWEALLASYPAIASYLLPFETAATARSDKGNYWWELRACDYYSLFAGDKIMWKEIATYQEFTLDTGGNYANNKTFFIPGHDLFLLGVLNSASAFFFLQQVTTKMKDNAMAMQIPQVSQLPIPPATVEEQATIAGWVQQVLTAKAADPAADTGALEQRIDAEVARLFGVE